MIVDLKYKYIALVVCVCANIEEWCVLGRENTKVMKNCVDGCLNKMFNETNNLRD